MDHPTASSAPARRRPSALRRWRGLALLFASAWACCAGAMAATDAERLGELERLLARSHALIQQLSQRVQQLEATADAKAPTTASTAPAAPALAIKLDALEQQLTALSNRPEPDRGLEMHGFADVGFALAGKGHDSGARVGSLDFYLTPRFGDRVKALVELNVETGDDGHVGVDLERAQIGVILSDAATLWLGRFHSPYGTWNTAFHHGAQLQTAVARPRFLEFEDAGGILPAHSVGFWLTGVTKLGTGRLGYDAYLSNAPTIQLADPTQAGSGVLDPGLRGADGRSASLGWNLNYEFGGGIAEGLHVGLHGLTTKVGDNAASAHQTRMRMFGGWAGYNENGWELLAEHYSFRNADLRAAGGGGGAGHASRAAYVQLGRQFGLFTPYLRLERADLDQTDPYFAEQASGQSYRRIAAGLRYDLNPTTAVKFEAMRSRFVDRTASQSSELRGQLAVRF